MLTFQLLPAREGDALWIRWGSPDAPYQMLIDMGPQETGTELRERIRALPEDQRSFELIVVTHIDRDHIGGLLSCLVDAEPLPGFTSKDIWFNGYAHLDGLKPYNEMESLGALQGERLSHWLSKQNWNKSFAGGPICCDTNLPLPYRDFEGGMRLTVLGPTVRRLSELKSVWRREVEAALKKSQRSEADGGFERLGTTSAPALVNKQALEQLAKKQLAADNSPANASSITLLLEYEGIRILLAGDALSKDLAESVQLISPNKPLELTAFKVPHHGSSKNLSKALIESVNCRYWLISTDGSRFQHPDDETVARILSYSTNSTTTVGFNVRSKFNAKWDSEVWRKEFDYDTVYGDGEEGLTMKF